MKRPLLIKFTISIFTFFALHSAYIAFTGPDFFLNLIGFLFLGGTAIVLTVNPNHGKWIVSFILVLGLLSFLFPPASEKPLPKTTQDKIEGALISIFLCLWIYLLLWGKKSKNYYEQYKKHYNL